MKAGIPQTAGEKLVKSLTNFCFSFFVLVVLILTVIAVTYHPPDPWTEPGKAIDQVLRSVKNATFRPDDSVLRTGEDFVLTSTENETIKALEGPAITVGTALEQQAAVDLATVCDPQQGSINCSDPRVLVAIVSYNLEHFSDLNFYAYQSPVKGATENDCDVSWRFRAKKEKSWRMYKDYRRFVISVNDVCNYTVVSSGDWHSGKNAKRSKFGKRGRPFGGSIPMIVPALAKNATVVEEVEVIDDSVPAQASPESTFRGRYLYYSRGGDHCKKMNQYLWSLLCALGEAKYLNRTLVVDLNLCLSGENNPGHADEDGKDFRFYFDYAHLKLEASVIEQKEFFDEWYRWNQTHHGAHIPVLEVSGAKTTPMELRQDRKPTIVIRNFDLQEPDNYWYRVCEGETEKAIQRPWHLIWKSKRLMDIVNSVCGKMGWDFDAIHVVRGDKAKNKELWPKLDADTSVDSLVAKLRDQIDTSRNVYIATNEMEPGYFDSFKDVYPRAYTLDDFRSLWDKDSEWYNQTMELTGGKLVEFDGYMRVEVDTEVTYRAKKKIETFGFLTNDCINGVNTC